MLLSESEKTSRLRKKQKKARSYVSFGLHFLSCSDCLNRLPLFRLGKDLSTAVLTAEDELKCIFRLRLPSRLSSCDLRVSRFVPRRKSVDEDASATSIIHVSPLSAYSQQNNRNNLLMHFYLTVVVLLPKQPYRGIRH